MRRQISGSFVALSTANSNESPIGRDRHDPHPNEGQHVTEYCERHDHSKVPEREIGRGDGSSDDHELDNQADEDADPPTPFITVANREVGDILLL